MAIDQTVFKVAFIGLGVMGYPMAGHLQQKGLSVCVYNRTPSKAVQWINQYGGTMAVTPAQAAADADFKTADHQPRRQPCKTANLFPVRRIY